MKAVSTVEMVQKMLNETRATKSSVGGTREFRSVCDFVNSRRWYDDYETVQSVERTPDQIANIVEREFSQDVIDEAKSVYL